MKRTINFSNYITDVMIKVNELRLGNAILYLDELYLVDGIKYEEQAPAEKYRVTFKTVNGKLRNAKMSSWIKPIPLTDEVLQSIRNISENLVLSKTLNGKYLFCCQTGLSEFGGFGMVTELEFLHQLQNLHFVLTGSELELGFKTEAK